jgi:hypothetical protein
VAIQDIQDVQYRATSFLEGRGRASRQVQYLLRTNGLVSVNWLSTQGVRKPLNVSMHACETGVVISSSAQNRNRLVHFHGRKSMVE